MAERRSFKPSLFVQESLLFIALQLIGLFAAYQLLQLPVPLVAPTEPVSATYFFVSMLFGLVLLVVLIRFVKSRVVWGLLFGLLIFVGSQATFLALGFGDAAPVFALVVTLLRFIYPRIWTQNLAILAALSGIGASLGLSIGPDGVIFLLVFLSVYDFVAVLFTNVLVRLFSNLVERGVLLSVVIPEQASNWGKDVSSMRPGPGSGVVILGTGDLVLPLVFAASVLPSSLIDSISIVIGSVFGLFAVHLALILMKQRRPLPALPPIAIGALAGFYISAVLL